MTQERVEPFVSMSLPVALDVHSVQLSDRQFQRLCRDNRDLRFELTAKGELIIMPPTGALTGWRNAKLTYRLTAWAEADGTGVTFDSSTGFTLPNGAKRSPDASWIKCERWEALTEKERQGFAPLCPDFVVELRSPEDSLSALQEKMVEYQESGAQLGLLIDPKAKRVYVYRPEQTVEVLENPEAVSCEPLLPLFALSLKDIW